MQFQSHCSMPFQSPGSLPEWIKLIPAGSFMGRDGRAFLNDQPDGIIAAFVSHHAALPVDVEHSSELKAKNGDPAPARGWIEELQNRAGAVWGRIEWNKLGAELVHNREYRYYSPAFLCEQASGRVIKLKSAGLTNSPNLFSTALNQHAISSDMHSQELLTQTFGLEGNTSQAAAIVAINAEEEQVCHLLGMPVEDFAKAKAENPASSHWPTVSQSSEIRVKGSGGPPVAINSEEEQVCRLIGMSIEDFAKAKAEEPATLP